MAVHGETAKRRFEYHSLQVGDHLRKTLTVRITRVRAEQFRGRVARPIATPEPTAARGKSKHKG